MATFSRVEWSNNRRGFIEEVNLLELDYDASLGGFVRTVTLLLGSARRDLPVIRTGTTTGALSLTRVVDTAADFFAVYTQPGDVVTNTTDGNAKWEVVTVDSATQLTVQLVTVGGGSNNFVMGAGYTVATHSLERTYIPFRTDVRITGRDINKVLLRGLVQEIIPQDEQGRILKVIIVSHEADLRDSSFNENVLVGKMRSGILQDELDRAVEGQLRFPRVSPYEGTPGLEHSPNVSTVTPDFALTARGAYSSMLDLARAEPWCADVLREPANPIITFTPPIPLSISEPTPEVATTVNATSYAMAAFTPAVNAFLVVMVFATETVAVATMTGGGLTWTLRRSQLYNATDTAYLFTAPVGTPALTTITFDCTGDAASGVVMICLQAIGRNIATPFKQHASSTGAGANPVITFAQALCAADGYIAGFGINRNPPGSTPPAAWTEVADAGYDTPTAGGTGAFRVFNEAIATATFTSAAGNWGGLGIEVLGEWQELKRRAQGSLAQSFLTGAVQPLVTRVTLRLGYQCTRPTGNMYVRLEANGRGSLGEISDMPSGDLVCPWAESKLVNIINITDPTGMDIHFNFLEPVPLRDGKIYWIVLSYQEDNNAGVVEGNDFVTWYDDAALGYGAGRMADYDTRWTLLLGRSAGFKVWTHVDAYWLYDFSMSTWEDQTTEVLAVGGGDGRFLSTLANDGHQRDRMYVRTSGPFKGLDLLVGTVSDTDYGGINVRYFADEGNKVVGQHTAAPSGPINPVLTDTDKDFRLLAVAVGDVVFNRTDGSLAVITAFTRTTITTGNLQGGVDNQYQAGDSYIVLNLEVRVSGLHVGAFSNTVLNVPTADFARDGVRIGDRVINVSANRVGTITGYTDQTITTTAAGMAMSWNDGNVYRVISRWRTLALKDRMRTFKTLNTVRLEWEIPEDWVPTKIDTTFAEPAVPPFTDVADMPGYWVTIQATTLPIIPVKLDKVSPLPGAGFVVGVADFTHRDVLNVLSGTHTGPANAAKLTDTTRNFINTDGIVIGDIVDNVTDRSSGVITAIETTTNEHDTLVATLTGGVENDWDIGDVYYLKRDRFQVRYFRQGSIPYGRPSTFGLTLREGGPPAKQIVATITDQISESTRSSVNQVRVVGKSLGGAVIQVTANNLRSQRDSGRVVFRAVTDLSIKTIAEATERANAELARMGEVLRRAVVVTAKFPYYTKVLERQNWLDFGVMFLAKLDGNGDGNVTYRHTGPNDSAFLRDDNQNFHKWLVEPGDIITNITDVSKGVITSVSTQTTENDRINGTLRGGTENLWDIGDQYRVERRSYIQVGDLVRVKVYDPGYVDADYLVVNIHYSEPSLLCELRLARNFISSGLGDQMKFEEIIQKIGDDTQRGLQIGSY